MYSQYRVVKKTGLILRYIVLLCIFSDYYHNPVLNEQIGGEDYVTDQFTYADLKIATTHYVQKQEILCPKICFPSKFLKTHFQLVPCISQPLTTSKVQIWICTP